jgi:hypothetical protein
MRDHRHGSPHPAAVPNGGADGMFALHSPRHRGESRAKLALLTWAAAYAEISLVLAIGGRGDGCLAAGAACAPSKRADGWLCDLGHRVGDDAAVPRWLLR